MADVRLAQEQKRREGVTTIFWGCIDNVAVPIDVLDLLKRHDSGEEIKLPKNRRKSISLADPHFGQTLERITMLCQQSQRGTISSLFIN